MACKDCGVSHSVPHGLTPRMGLLGPIAHFITPIRLSRSARSNQRAWKNRANEANCQNGRNPDGEAAEKRANEANGILGKPCRLSGEMAVMPTAKPPKSARTKPMVFWANFIDYFEGASRIGESRRAAKQSQKLCRRRSEIDAGTRTIRG